MCSSDLTAREEAAAAPAATAVASHGRSADGGTTATERERQRKVSAMDGPSARGAVADVSAAEGAGAGLAQRRSVDRRRGVSWSDADGTSSASSRPEEADSPPRPSQPPTPVEPPNEAPPAVTVDMESVVPASDVSVDSVDAAARPTARAVVEPGPPPPPPSADGGVH